MDLGMGCCHTLSIIVSETTNNKKLGESSERSGRSILGDPLDLEMYHSSNYFLEDDKKIIRNKSTNQQYIYIKQQPFQSENAFMYVTIQESSTNLNLKFTKGAPEVINQMSSVIPDNYEKTVQKYVNEGNRVIAISVEVESNQKQVILGLLILENVLKPETIPTIETLNYAEIPSVMITGDNLKTSIAIGRKCKILNDDWTINDQVPQPIEITNKEHLGGQLDIKNLDLSFRNSHPIAIEGDIFEEILKNYETDSVKFPENKFLLEKLIQNCKIFARMKPHQKELVIHLFKNANKTVMMVGDGANDCNALKIAHVGISLSKLEASIAAPFTSFYENIECVVKFINEGRCSLVTTFSIFKFIALYSLIQLCTICILYYYNTNLSDWEYLYIDLFIISLNSIAIGLNGPPESISKTVLSNSKARKLKLTKKRPPKSLISDKVLLSLFGQIFLQAIFQLIVHLTFLSTMKCWRSGYIPEGSEYCACSNITDISSTNDPNFYSNGTYTIYSEHRYVINLFKLDEQEFQCFGNCTASYDEIEHELFSDFQSSFSNDNKLPNYKLQEAVGQTVYNKSTWNQLCLLPTPDTFEEYAMNVHKYVTKTFPTTIMFYFTVFQYLTLALVFTTGPPFRAPVYKNILLMGSQTILSGLIIYCLLFEHEWIRLSFGLVKIPEYGPFLVMILAFIILNTFCTIMLEKFVESGRATKYWKKIKDCF